MIKRYDMTRSDNYILTKTETVTIVPTDGTFIITTGFPVKSALVVSEQLSSGSIYVSDYLEDGFEVTYEGLSVTSLVVSYMAQ